MTTAYIDVAPECLRDFLAVLPGAIKVIGTADKLTCCRLVLDVAATGLDGGQWNILITHDGPRMTATLGPVGTL